MIIRVFIFLISSFLVHTLAHGQPFKHDAQYKTASNNTSNDSLVYHYFSSNDLETTNNAVITHKDTITLNKGDSFFSAMSDYALSSADLVYILKVSKPHINLNTLQENQLIQVRHRDQQVIDIAIPYSFGNTLVVYQAFNIWQSLVRYSPTKIESRYVKGIITDNLYNSAKHAGAPPKIINQYILALSSNVHFGKDVRKGDVFSMLFNIEIDLQKPHKHKPLLLDFFSLETRGSTEKLFRFEHNGTSTYYNREGYSQNPLLLLNPVKNGILSSYFGLRQHPILGYKRPHTGIDFDADLGTDIMAAGDGVVVKRAYSPTFGYHIKIRHERGYETLYAHLDRFAKHTLKGTKVQQGEVIGYLGNSGLSTARHVHYEVHKHGRAIDPLSLRANQKTRLTGTDYDTFLIKVNHIERMLCQMQVAQI